MKSLAYLKLFFVPTFFNSCTFIRQLKNSLIILVGLFVAEIIKIKIVSFSFKLITLIGACLVE